MPGWGAVAHVFIATAVALPLLAAATVIGFAATEDQAPLDLGLLSLMGVGFFAAVVWLALLPPVRQVEVATACALLSLRLPDVEHPESWDSRRRGALWLGLLVIVGTVVAAGILYLVPAGVGLVAHPFSGNESLEWPGAAGEVETGRGWEAAWAIVPGLLSLAAAAALVAGAGRLLTWAAPRMIGPSATEQLAVTAARERELTRANEMAREVHDSIGHTITAMTVQATAARRLLTEDPAAAEQALAAVERIGRRAQADVDVVVGALRRGARDESEQSRDVIELLATSLDGTPLRLTTELPDELVLSADQAHTVNRFVQEALTNATRYGTGAAELRMFETDGVVVIEVRNEVRNEVRTPGGGRSSTGLAGLRERVVLHGGTLEAGPEGESWVLRATLPTG